jgi:sulfur carrier protein ThiS
MILYEHDTTNTPWIAARREYEFTTQAEELQRAHDLADEYDIRDGSVAIMENGSCINKITI